MSKNIFDRIRSYRDSSRAELKALSATDDNENQRHYLKGRVDAFDEALCNHWKVSKIIAELIPELEIAELKALAELMDSKRYAMERKVKTDLMS